MIRWKINMPYLTHFLGQMVYFLGFSKGKDSARKVFNPVKCDYEYHGVTEMSTVAK